MTKGENMLTHFQEIAGMALDLSDKEAQKIQQQWPVCQDELRQVLRQWKKITNSDVPGVQLLMACDAIWKQRPSDLAEVEGREILYHPINGQPIPSNHPLDGLPWEILAFLHWANRENLLPWTDEIAIAREINEAQGVIDNLPGDRFYAKNMLPRLPAGEIDWSDLSMAQAKRFVCQGGTSPINQDQEPVYVGDDLIGLLSSIPALANEGTRNILLKGLPPRLIGYIRRNTAIRTDLYNIVEAAEGAGRLSNGKYGINVIIDNAIQFVAGTQFEDRLRKFKK